MAEFPAMPLWTDAYLGDTTHLSTFEHGAYFLLLVVSWRSPGCCLPDDDGLLARYTRMTRDKWRKVRPILEPFFRIDDGFWHQARLQDELQHLQSRREQQREAGNASAKAKSLKRKNRGSTTVGNPLQRKVNETSTPISIPTKLKEEANASSKKRAVGCRLADDWKPSDDDIVFAKEKGLSAERIAEIAEEYADYWRAQPGQRGVKLDWPATWRNWIRREGKRPAANGTKPGKGAARYVSKTGFEYHGTPHDCARQAEKRGDMDTYWKIKGDLSRNKEAEPIGGAIKRLVGSVN